MVSSWPSASKAPENTSMLLHFRRDSCSVLPKSSIKRELIPRMVDAAKSFDVRENTKYA